MHQMTLFSPDVVPLRIQVYQARIQNIRVAKRNHCFTKGLEAAVNNLTHTVEAILDADPINLRMAGVTPAMALELAARLSSAARAVVRKPVNP